MTNDSDLLSRIRQYAIRRKAEIHELLGSGVQGTVYSTTQRTAIKAFRMREHFLREVAVYERIKERGITKVCGFSVPYPLSHHDEFMIIHMEIVRPPFVLDFASAGVDAPLYEYSEETMAEWQEERKELFGEERWPIVRKIMSEFRSNGIYLSDVKPGNIMFAD
jgi:hypothetical protein